MKNSKILLILLGFIYTQLIGNCEMPNKPNVSQKIYWGGASPNAVAAQANRRYGVNSSSDGSPDAEQSMFNPIGAYGNMLQMMNPSNTYNAVEMQKQQADYVKQQVSD